MAVLFNRETKIICSENHFTSQNNVGKNKWVLLPCIAYKVIVPYPADKEFNLFQEYVIKMLDLGVRDVKTISEKLCLQEPLVDFILRQLQELNWIDSDKIPNESCLRILNQTEDDCDKISGWIFKDVIGNCLLDVFVPELEEVKQEFKGHNNRSFTYGAAGNSRDYYAYALYPEKDKSIDSEITPIEILEACKKHRIRTNKILRGEKGSTGEMQAVSIPKNVSDVSITGIEEPVYLATKVFLQNDNNWQIIHPFGTLYSPRIKSELEQLLSKSSYEHLKEAIDDLVGESNILVRDIGQTDKKLLSVKEQYGEKILKFPQLCTYLADYCDKYNNLGVDNKNIAGKIFDELADLGYKMVAELFYIVLQKFEYENLHRKLTKEPTENSELLSKIATHKCGFKYGNGDVVNKFLKIKIGQVRNAADNKELKSLFAANILLTTDYSYHPFFKMADDMPFLIENLVFLSELRKSADHDSSSQIEESQLKEQKSILDKVILSLLKSSLELSSTDQNSAQNNNIKYDRLSKHSIDSEFGKFFFETESDMFDYIYKIEYNLLTYTDYLSDSEKQNIKDNIVIQLNNICENLITRFAKELDYTFKSYLISHSRDENSQLIEAACKKYSFSTESLPDSSKKIDPKKIKDSFKHFTTATLNCKLYVLLITAGDIDEFEILHRISLEIPDFIEFVFKIADLRGHGVAVDASIDELKNLKSKIYDVLKKIITIIKE